MEDLVQESLLAIHNQRHTYGVGQPLTPWIQAISKYKLVDLLRRRERCELLTDSMDSTCLAAFVLARADEVTRVRLFYGDTWNVCPFLIVMRRRRCLWA